MTNTKLREEINKILDFGKANHDLCDPKKCVCLKLEILINNHTRDLIGEDQKFPKGYPKWNKEQIMFASIAKIRNGFRAEMREKLKPNQPKL